MRWSRQRSQLKSQVNRCRSPRPTVAVPKLPEPPTTDQVADWVSGPATGGNLPTRPAPEGPLKDNAATTDAATAPTISANTPSGDRSDLRIVNSGSAASSNGAEGSVRWWKATSAPIASRGVPEIYADRMASDRIAIARQRGGSPETESAVQAALRWLAINQSADGRWDANKFGAGRELAVLGQDRQGAGAKADSAVTGLALLAFLGAGNTHYQGDYAKNVQRGLEYLINVQGNDGNLAGQAETFAYMYSHGMATLAMSEAYAMTGDKRIEPTVQKAIGYTLRAQIRSTGGWRYQAVEKPAERGDTSQLGWQFMSIKSAELAGLQVPGTAGDGAVRFLKSVASGLSGGKASYRPGEAPSRTMTAEALVCRQFLGMARENPASNEAGEYLLGQLPSTDKINLYYWYYGTLGMYQLQGDYWQRWNRQCKPHCAAGSTSTATRRAVGILNASGAATAGESIAPRCRPCAWKCTIDICQSTVWPIAKWCQWQLNSGNSAELSFGYFDGPRRKFSRRNDFFVPNASPSFDTRRRAGRMR